MNNYTDLLRECNLKVTPQRLAIADLLHLKYAIIEMGCIQLGIKVTDAQAESVTTFLGALEGRKPDMSMPMLPASTDKAPKPDMN